MKLNVYVDGFNLYYGSLKNTPYKWLNLLKFCNLTFPADQINRIRYFTARVRSRPHNPHQAVRQDIYLSALKTIPCLGIHEGSYLDNSIRLPLDQPPPPVFVNVRKSEEKGSDVNLASYLLVDAFDVKEGHDGSVVISNDSDLALPIELTRTKFGKRIIMLYPCRKPRRPSGKLRQAAATMGKDLIVDQALLARGPFDQVVTNAQGQRFKKPLNW